MSLFLFGCVLTVISPAGDFRDSRRSKLRSALSRISSRGGGGDESRAAKVASDAPRAQFTPRIICINASLAYRQVTRRWWSKLARARGGVSYGGKGWVMYEIIRAPNLCAVPDCLGVQSDINCRDKMLRSCPFRRTRERVAPLDETNRSQKSRATGRSIGKLVKEERGRKAFTDHRPLNKVVFHGLIIHSVTRVATGVRV